MFLETVTPGWRVQDSEHRTGMMGALKNVKLTGQNAITHGKENTRNYTLHTQI